LFGVLCWQSCPASEHLFAAKHSKPLAITWQGRKLLAYQTRQEIAMTVRIEKDGWVVSGDTPEDLAIGIAAVQQALAAGNGKPTALSITREKPAKPPTRSPGSRGRSDRPSDDEMQATTLTFLTTIRDGGDRGVYGESLRIALGLKDGRAMGGSMASINRTITDAGFEPEPDAYRRTRDTEGRRWQPGQKIDKVIGALNKKD
jgi:hypothetical protein